jgi:hypothetical protein
LQCRNDPWNSPESTRQNPLTLFCREYSSPLICPAAPSGIDSKGSPCVAVRQALVREGMEMPIKTSRIKSMQKKRIRLQLLLLPCVYGQRDSMSTIPHGELDK